MEVRPIEGEGLGVVLDELTINEVQFVKLEGTKSGSQFAPDRKFSVKELMQHEFAPQMFIVEGLLPTGLTMIAGAPKIGKSWFCMDLALCIASGRPFLGRETQQGAVLYLALEDQPRRLKERMKKVAPDADWSTLPMDIWTESRAMDEGGLDDLRKWLEAAVNPRAIMIDVWGRFEPRTASTKNEYSHITHTMQQLQQLIAENDVALLLVHHTRKSTGDGAATADPFDQVIGSRGLTSNMDATMMLTRARMQQDASLDITGRDIEEISLHVTFNKETCRWDETNRVLAPALNHERQQVLDAFISGHRTAQSIGDHLGKSRTSVQNHLTGLVDGNLLVRPHKGEYHLPLQAAPPSGEFPELPTDMTDMVDINDEVFTPGASRHHVA